MINLKTNLPLEKPVLDWASILSVFILLVSFFAFVIDVLPQRGFVTERAQLQDGEDVAIGLVHLYMDAQHVIYIGYEKHIADLTTIEAALQSEIKKFQESNPEILPTISLEIDSSVEYGSFLHLFSLVQKTNYPIILSYACPSF